MKSRPPTIDGRAGAFVSNRPALLSYISLTAALVAAPCTAASVDQSSLPLLAPDIVVTGDRGRWIAAPERIVGVDSISSYGTASVGELIGEILVEEGDSGADTVILVNGRRVSGLGSIADYPTESVERVDILPPGSASRLGPFRTQRVYNVILKARSAVRSSRIAARAATRGGWRSVSGEIGATRIDRPRRINLTLSGVAESALSEAERAIVQPPGAPDGIGRQRTLRPSLDRFKARASAADRLAPWLHAEATLTLDKGSSRSRLGPSAAGLPIVQDSNSNAANGDLTLEAEWHSWLFVLAGNIRQDRRTVETQRQSSGRPPVVTSTNRGASLEASASGPLLTLPAGIAQVSLGAQASSDRLESRASGNRTRLTQKFREIRAGIDLPVTSRGGGFLSALGDINLGVELRRGSSGVAALQSDSWTIRWQLADWLRLFGSRTSSRSQPSVELLAAPIVATPGVRFFDPVRGETVDVVTVQGGNPELGRFATRRDRLSLRIDPFDRLDLSFNAELVRAQSHDQPAALPFASRDVQQQYDDRFERDSAGALIGVDLRPVAIFRQSEDELRYGFNLTLPSRAGTGSGTQPGGRVQVSASHRILLASTVQFRPGSSEIDLLSRFAAGLGEARPRHMVELVAGYALPGLGVRLSAERRSSSFLGTSTDESVQNLRFAPLTRIGLRAFVEGSRLVPGVSSLSGSRLSVTVNNLTDVREDVRDEDEATPFAYQPAYRDPLGRTVEFEFRMAF